MSSLKGRRLTVFDIVTKLFYEVSIGVALEDYEITVQDATDAVRYCVNRDRRADNDRVHYRDGCILRTLQKDRLDVLKEIFNSENKLVQKAENENRQVKLKSLKFLI